jgi:hypothetical protein
VESVIEKEIYIGVLMLVVSMLHGAVIQMHGAALSILESIV